MWPQSRIRLHDADRMSLYRLSRRDKLINHPRFAYWSHAFHLLKGESLFTVLRRICHISMCLAWKSYFTLHVPLRAFNQRKTFEALLFDSTRVILKGPFSNVLPMKIVVCIIYCQLVKRMILPTSYEIDRNVTFYLFTLRDT
jgi:hypothetical protein